MKPLADQDHYEVLEVPRDASVEGIERAYRIVRDALAPDSLAGYPVVRGADAEAIRKRVELAYRVLSDGEARREYDEELSHEEQETAPSPDPDPGPPPGAFEDFEDAGGDFDGQRLRRARLRRGVELDEIAAATKISPSYLRFLEEERFLELPPRVYVRGFVAAYAAHLGLEPGPVAETYMRGYDAAQPELERRIARRR